MSEGFEPDLFLTEFVHECREAVELAVQDVLNLEEKQDQDSIDRIFRVLHSIKGNSSMMGYMDLSKFVHKVEDACSDIRSGQREIDREVISVLLKSFDLVEEAFEAIFEEGHDKIDYSGGYNLFGAAGDSALKPQSASSEPAIPEPVEKKQPEASVPEGSVAEPVEPVAESAVGVIEVRKDPTALIVDDDFANRKILSTFLSKYMPCYVAKDGVEAIQAVSESLSGNAPRFDVIMLDIMMPNIDGLQACKAIRQMERGSNADAFGKESKIFIVSSLDDDKTIHKAVYECQADSYIVKPVMFENLKKQLARFKLIAP
ncbi:response regulator [Desulfovibrio sp. JC010]|uniref:ATP-binding response regulator n=1 Tax=Desulfovibrio sp. JC010 TaxID=2593641 RepID=UPI0013D893BF|nr:response regulator [Desulfovibrio sp. JC010]NDV26780.1 response regulator [Desulfovibrio sp. JC010]